MLSFLFPTEAVQTAPGFLSVLINHTNLIFEGWLVVDGGCPGTTIAGTGEDFFAIHEEVHVIEGTR